VEVYHQTGGQLDRETLQAGQDHAINKFHDLSLLHIEDRTRPKFKPVTLGSADALSVGDGVFAIGSPLGLERTVTQGILTPRRASLKRALSPDQHADQSGNSGGPLFNLAGESSA